MKNLKQRLYDFVVAVITGCVTFSILLVMDYFLNLEKDLFKKILSGLAAGGTYLIEKFYRI